jgi:hypothetical protein
VVYYKSNKYLIIGENTVIMLIGMKMQEKGKKSRAEYVCGINLRQDTSRQL